MKTLTKKQLKQLENEYPKWKLSTSASKISKTYIFEKHIDALIFIARISVNAEILKHHPEINFTSCRVKISLSTKEERAITPKDVLLLKKIESISLVKGDK